MNEGYSAVPIAEAEAGSIGTLSIYVLNRLSAPESTTGCPVEILLWTHMEDDARFNQLAANYQFVSFINPASSEEGFFASDECTPDETKILMNDPFKYSDNTFGMYFGESVLSTRALLQRYSFHFVATPLHDGLNDIVIRIPRRGIWRGPTSEANPGIAITNFAPNTAIGPRNENFVYTTALQYWSSAFIGQRGSIRFKLVSTMQNPQGQYPIIFGSWQNTGNPSGFFTATTNTSYNNVDLFALGIASQLHYGAQLESAAHNGTCEIEVPFYTNRKFIHNRTTREETEIPQALFTSNLTQTTPQDTNAYGGYYVFTAAGDDFTLLGYVGPPRIYIEPTYPFRV
jgi:hypothetical protein